ncbi:MAG: hypothetical protein K1X61_13330 [Chitinophagales bacterium]|nr:hypothetical protein [Chitinophagales bacterium]
MITLNQIVSSNLEILREQEVSLLKSLDFIRKARKLFESESETQVSGRAGRNQSTLNKKITSKREKQSPAKSKGKIVKQTRTNRLESIIAVLKNKKEPISSGELLEELFKQQTATKDKKYFGTLIYPVLTKACRSGKLKLKGGKIHLIS